MAMTNAAMANTMINNTPGSNRAGIARKVLRIIGGDQARCTGRGNEPYECQRSLAPEVMAPFASHVVVGHRFLAVRAHEYFCAGLDRFLCTRDRIVLHARLE